MILRGFSGTKHGRINPLLKIDSMVSKRRLQIEAEIFEDSIRNLEDFTVCEVLNHLYSLEAISEYIEMKRKELIKDILDVFKKQYYWRDEGNPVEFSDDIIEIVTGFSLGVKKIIKEIRKNKMTIFELVAYHRVLVKNEDWYTLFMEIEDKKQTDE